MKGYATNRSRLTRAQRASVWLVNRLPPVLVRDTERVMVAAALLLVGVTSSMAIYEPGTISNLLPLPLVIEWAATLFFGGVFTLVGMWRSWRATERAGLSLLGIGSFTYAMALISSGTPRAYISSLVFLAFTFGFIVRLCSSTAVAAALHLKHGGEDKC